MKYNGIELKEFKSDKPVVFDQPKKMFVFDKAELLDNDYIDTVYAYIPDAEYPVKTGRNCFERCAEIPEIPEEPKPRRATNLELAKWLSQGNGIYRLTCLPASWGSELALRNDTSECAVNNDIQIRKWDDKEWHEPTADYMGLER